MKESKVDLFAITIMLGMMSIYAFPYLMEWFCGYCLSKCDTDTLQALSDLLPKGM